MTEEKINKIAVDFASCFFKNKISIFAISKQGEQKFFKASSKQGKYIFIESEIHGDVEKIIFSTVTDKITELNILTKDIKNNLRSIYL